MEPNVCLLLASSVGVKTEHARLNHIKPVENVSCHSDFGLVTSWPTQFVHISIWIPLSAMRLPTQRYRYDMTNSNSHFMYSFNLACSVLTPQMALVVGTCLVSSILHSFLYMAVRDFVCRIDLWHPFVQGAAS
jgi:hypothetical protein